MNVFNYGVPVFYDKQVLSDVVLELQKNYNYAVVQFQDSAGNYVLTPGLIARYRRDGVDPLQNPSTDFYAGDGDTIVFSNSELIKGVRLINAANTQAMQVCIQYYRNTP